MAKIRKFFEHISLAQQFMLASLVVLAISMAGLGWWVGKEIEFGVINRTAGETSLYVDSFIDPPLQHLTQGSDLQPNDIDMLSHLAKDTPLGQHIVAFKVWDMHGRVVYSTNPDLIGQVYPIKPELAGAMLGNVVADISDLSDAENLLERGRWKRLLETYSPITKDSTSQIIGVVEFYQTVDTLDREILKARQSSWLVLGAAFLMVYLVLSIFVQRTSNTISHQDSELKNQVNRLTDLLAQNADLHNRAALATSRSAALNERFLRRIGAELHDGPAQDLGYALLRLDGVLAQAEKLPDAALREPSATNELKDIETSLQHALQEIRAISSGMGLPELDQLSLPETLERVVQAHERRTGTKVDYLYEGSAEQASLSAKITSYRLVQEALNNSFRHAKGIGQQVRASCQDGELNIQVSDQGAGFDAQHKIDQDVHLGLSGIRERVNSLGGLFHIESVKGQGTLIKAQIPLQTGRYPNE